MVAVWREIEIGEGDSRFLCRYRVYLFDCGDMVFLELTQRELDELREMKIRVEDDL